MMGWDQTPEEVMKPGQVTPVKNLFLVGQWTYPQGGVLIDGSAVQMFREYHKQGKMAGQVWVTPEVPFLIFITCSFVTSTFLGKLFSG